MLDQQLKVQTQSEHAALEKRFLQVIRSINTRIDYADFLSKLYGYYFAIEQQLDPYLADSEIFDYSSRRKAYRLVNDITNVGNQIHNLALCRNLPRVDSFHSALGVLYVLEGSTLGGKIIAGIISSKLNSDDGMTFFMSYGSSTPEMWKRFREYLQKPYTKKEEETIISSALFTFITLKQWLSSDE